MKQLFNSPRLRGFLGYLIVGGLATIVEWAGFWLFDRVFGMQYLAATALAFVFSTFANWGFGRLLVFRGGGKLSLGRELAAVYAASAGGLGLNLILMFALVHGLRVDSMLAKMLATVIVFAYNYLIRKLVIYKK